MDTKIYLKRKINAPALILSFLCFLHLGIKAQLTVPNYNACPNQTVMITATWNNVSTISYSLANSSGLPPYLAISNVTNSFIVSSPTSTTFVLYAQGNQNGNPVASSVTVNLFVTPPAPLTITNTGQYCHGATATLTAPIGGNVYNVSGPPGTPNIASGPNIITIPNLAASPNNGAYTITSVFAGCTRTGVTNISVAPNVVLSTSSPTSVCLGSSFCFTANLPGPNSDVYFWQGPITSGYNATGSGANPPCATFTTLSMSGTYSVLTNQTFGNITCPFTATTVVSVVATYPVLPTATPSRTLCEGANLSLSASGPGTLAIGYTWVGPQGYSSSLQSTILTNIVPNMTGVYSVTALFTNGVVTCTTGASISTSVVGTSQPVIIATSNVCEGGTAVLSASTSPAIPILPLSWTGPQSWVANGNNAQITNIQANQSGVYYVYATFSSNNPQCITSKSVQINVVPVNTISVIPPGSVCQPNNAFLQASAIGAYQFSWAGPNGYTSSLPNTTVYYPTSLASGIYTITATFYNGIIYCYNTNTVSLTVNPVLNFTLIPRQQVCYEKSIQVNGPNGATSYTWTSSTGFTSNVQNINFPSIQPNQSGSYTLNVSLGPCITTQTTLIDVLTPIQFTLFPYNRTICRGDTTVLSGAVSGGSENYSYTWNPSIYLPTPNGNVQTCVPLSTTIYNLIAHDVLCPDKKVSSTFSVIVNQPPTPDLKLEKVESCTPLCLLYNSKTKKESKIITYDFGGIRKMQRDSFYYCLDVPGTYTLNVATTGTNGCSGTFQYPDLLVVNPKPSPRITWEPESPTITDEITFASNTKYQASSYTWMFAGISPSLEDTTNLSSPKIFYDNIGKYPIILISKTDKECSDTVLKYIDIRDDYNIFIPNTFTPNDDGLNDVFQVKATGVSLSGFTMDIFDRWGNLVYTSKDITVGWDGKESGKKCNDGIYIYKIKIIGANGEGRKELKGRLALIK
jgi:gliding motility-associated-like protein